MDEKLRFPKTIWNAYTTAPPRRSPLQRHLRSPTNPGLSLSIPSSPNLESNHTQKLASVTPSSLPWTSTHSSSSSPPLSHPKSPLACKFKLHHFHHGGPQRARRGCMQHIVTLDRPCFRATCGNCWVWQWRDMHVRYGEQGCEDDVEAITGQSPPEDGFAERTEIMPEEQMQEKFANSTIDPRILDGSWRRVKSIDLSKITSVARPAMSLHATSDAQTGLLLTPVKPDFGTYHPEPSSPFQTAVFPACAAIGGWEAVRAETKPAVVHYGSLGITWKKAGRKKGSTISKVSIEEQKLRKREYDRKRRERMKIARK